MVNQQADLEVVRKVPIPSSSATMFLHSSLRATWTNPDSRTVSLDLPGLFNILLDALLLKENDATPETVHLRPNLFAVDMSRVRGSDSQCKLTEHGVSGWR